MKSAFGVDHGHEVEKALGLGALKPLGAAFKAGKAGMAGPAASGAAGHAMGLGRMAGKAQSTKVGQFAVKNKTALGLAGAAGGGVAGGSMLNRRR